MGVKEIIFSPTGGTLRVSQIIAGQWEDNSQIIDLSNAETDFSKVIIEKDDLVLIAMPVYGSRPPAVAIERLKQIDGNGARCILVCVYGNGDYGDTISEMNGAAKESDFQVIAAIAAIAQHSIISEYAVGRPDETDCNQLTDFAGQIIDKTSPFICSHKTQHINESDDVESKPQAPAEPPLPKVDETCVKCGLCERTCPVQAITPEDFISDVEKCIFCMRCIKQCPNESRKVNEDVLLQAALALKDTCSLRKENELFI